MTLTIQIAFEAVTHQQSNAMADHVEVMVAKLLHEETCKGNIKVADVESTKA